MENEQDIVKLKVIEQDNYEVAFNEAAELLKDTDILKISQKTGAEIIIKNNITNIKIHFLLDEIIITHPDISFSYTNKDEEVSMWLKILILHYLVHSKGTRPSGDQITFKQLEGGMSYFSAFQKRTIEPIKKVFGNDLNDFIKAGELIGGVKSDYGDFSITFQAFPKMEVTYIFWEGDDELPMEGSVVFDSSFKDYMSTEDIAVLCNMISIIMIKKKHSPEFTT